MKRKTLVATVVAAIGLAVPASASATDLIGSGSVAAQPVLQPLFHAYSHSHPNLHFIYTANGGNAGVQDVQQGRSMFAGQSRPPLPSDAGTTYIKMYLDGLCIDVNPHNSMTNVSIPTLRNIWLGNSTSWSGVSGSQLNSTIDPFGRDPTGGTYTFFSQAVLGGKTPSSRVTQLGGDGLVENAIAKDQNAIGYAGLAWQKRDVKKLKVNSITCSPRQIKSLHYPLSRFIWLVLPTAHPNVQVEKFADWARTSVRAGEIIQRAGAVPAFNKKPHHHHHH
jgi:phosphate transport system substrate-binding protein